MNFEKGWMALISLDNRLVGIIWGLRFPSSKIYTFILDWRPNCLSSGLFLQVFSTHLLSSYSPSVCGMTLSIAPLSGDIFGSPIFQLSQTESFLIDCSPVTATVKLIGSWAASCIIPTGIDITCSALQSWGSWCFLDIAFSALQSWGCWCFFWVLQFRDSALDISYCNQ